MIITADIDDDDDDEPIFRVRYVAKGTHDNADDYWEQYERTSKVWTRLCADCVREVCDASGVLCEQHHNKENVPVGGMGRVTKQSRKRPTQLKKRTRTKKKCPLEPINEAEANEPLEIVLSVSSSLNKKQLAQVNQFIAKFNNSAQSIQFTCEFQPDYIDASTTHVITTDCGSFSTPLTKQIIQACAHHTFVSSIDWINSSLEHACILDHFPFEILRDKQSSFGSRGIKQCRFDQLPVFPSSCVISVECRSGVPSMKMTREELTDIVESSGATLDCEQLRYPTLITLCNSRQEMLASKRSDHAAMNGRTVYYCKPEFVFHSIARHEVQRIEDYCW